MTHLFLQLRNGTILSTNPPPPSYQPVVQPPPSSYFPNSQQRPSSTPLNLNDIRPNLLLPNQSSSYHTHHLSSPAVAQGMSGGGSSGGAGAGAGAAAQNRFFVNSKPIARDSSDNRPMSREKLHIPLPPVPNSFPELEKLSVAQLKKLLTDDAAINVLPSSFLWFHESSPGSYCQTGLR
jgi:hypothetical protein